MCDNFSIQSNMVRTKEENASFCSINRERLFIRSEELKNKWLNSIQVYNKAREAEIIAYKMINKEPPSLINNL